MHGKIERPPVDWEERTAPEPPPRGHGVVRTHVNVAPRGVIGSYLERYDVEWTESFGDVSKFRR